MSDAVLIAVVGLLSAFLSGGGVLAYVALKKSKTEIKVLDTQGTSNIAKALNDAAVAMGAILNASEADRQEAVSDRKDLEARVDELEAHRSMRSREIYTLQQNLEKLTQDYEKLNRVYAAETGKLREEVRLLQMKIAEGEEKNKTYKTVIERLIEALRKVDPQLLDGIELPETLEKIKAVKR
jgi:chromosome segregation ATPase